MAPFAPDAWARVSALVAEAADLAPAERGPFLAGLPPGPVADEVRSLVAAHEAAEAADALAGPFAEARAQPGARLGPYEIVGELGRGGMGAVYRAERADGQFERTVALKVVRHAGPDLARRFAREQRVLARLEHPHIARLYDAGLAPDGALGETPYLAMELVEGTPITDYAAHHRLSARDRVRLLVQVCDAVAYAHGRLVLHRDLKPSNVLVEGPPDAPRAVVLDFGIARLLGDDPVDQTQTALALTPGYAAPEQLRGEAVTTATDVYGLGVLAYEVLAGRRPHAVEGLAPTQVERALAVPPDAPSAVGGDALRGDLDTVVLKALAAEPDRRYASAEALGEDLRRHLDDLPVRARPATLAVRARAFARRNRVPVLAGAAVALALVGGLGAALWQARAADAARQRAEARFEIAREAARAMIYDVHDAVAGLPGATPAREVIVDQALTYLDRLADDAGGDPSLVVDLAGAYFRIGNVQGSPTNDNLGRTADARASYARGLRLLADLPMGLPDSLAGAAAETEGRLWEKLGVVVAHTDGPDSAAAHFDRALDAYRRAVRILPDSSLQRVYLSTGYINRGDYAGHPYFPHAGRPDDALADYARARRILRTIPPPERSLFALRMLGITHEREGNLLRERGDLDAAAPPTRRALALRQQIARRPDATAAAERDVGVSHEAVGRLAAERGRAAEAERELGAALAVYQRLADADVESVHAQETLALGHLALARFYDGVGRRADARRHATDAAGLLGTVARADLGNTRARQLADEARALRDRLR